MDKLGIYLAVVVLFLIISIAYLNKQKNIAENEVYDLRNQLALQNKAVENYKAQSLAIQAKLKAAETLATNNLKKAKLQVEAIMASNVSSNCTSAIKWGAQQAIKMRQK